MRTLHQAFDPRNNALNAVRLSLALGVIFWHSFPLTGRDINFEPAREIMAEVWVDGFFAISGFLIVRSWVRRPDVRAYLKARALRIYPAFWTCLIVTSFATVPIGLWIATGDASQATLTHDNFGYVYKNLSLLVFQTDINGTPLDVPYPGKWNSSLWTLPYEAICYLGVLALGVTGLLRRRFTLVALLAFAELAMLLTSNGVVDNFFLLSASRFALMFISGAVVYKYSHRLPATWWAVGAGAAITAASTFLVDYRLVAAVPLAFTMITTGALLTSKRLNLQNDFSYGTYIYAFPLQQLLVLSGLGDLNVIAFALLSICLTVPFAVASWFLVEKPILSRRKSVKALQPVAPIAGG